MFIKIIALISIISFDAFALESITIPDAVCGNGSPYKVFIDKQEDEKLMVEFMGGGACWDFTSCFIIPHTLIFPIPNLSSLSIFTDNNLEINFLKKHSKIYFPYCTGDVHIGNHIGHYANNTKVHHVGYMNVINTLKYLKSNKIIKFNKVKDLVIWGASAGALGSMAHGKTIESMVPTSAHKAMIIDSPGLHWGKTFWEKFSRDMIYDFDQAFSKVNIHIDFTDGLMAKDMKPFFTTYKTWQLGFLFGTKDLIMSTVFGDISPYDHQSLLLSKQGFPYLANQYQNTYVWVRDTPMHTFLILTKSAALESFDGVTAIDFAKEVYEAN
jgi:hypothetical protein